MTHRRAALILAGCTVIWGGSFALNKLALASVSPLLLMGVRFTIAAALLAAVYPRTTRADWRVGGVLGALFGLQIALFITGLDRIPSTRAAFLLGMATPLVPVVLMLVTRQPPRGRDLAAVALAGIGLWWLTGPGDAGGVGTGDLLMLGSAACGAVYVVAAGHWAPRHDPMRILAVQVVVMGAVGYVLMLAFEQPRFEPRLDVVALVAFLALSGIATFGGQLVGQRVVPATEAALIFAPEPVVAAAAGYVALGESLQGMQWVGAAAILVATFAVRKPRRTVPAPAAAEPATG
jgi:drug/metabolite transporter (DMT)-like permease